jgi:hypothetical protein
MATESLWPTEFPELPESSPVVILRAQGDALGAITHGVVVGRVVPFSVPGVPVIGPGGEVFAVGGPNRLVNTFQLYVPALDYSYDLLIVSHTAVQYPADVFRMYEGAERLGANPQRASSEEQFVQLLRSIFASREVGRIVQLLRQEAAAAPQQ